MAAAAPASPATSIESLGDDQATHFEESAGGTVPSTGQVSVLMRDAEFDRLISSRGLQVTPPAATGASAHMEVIVNSSAHAIRAMFDGMSDAEVVALMTSKSLASICQPQAAPATGGELCSELLRGISSYCEMFQILIFAKTIYFRLSCGAYFCCKSARLEF